MLRTPILVEFDKLDLFIKTVFSDIELYLLDKLSSNLPPSRVEVMAYHELE